jgi:transcriptional antiterminator NusG
LRDANSTFNPQPWFAIRTKSNRESVVLASLVSKGYQTFLPMYESGTSVDTVAKRARSIPLFPGYLFCRFDVQRRQPIVMTPGVVYIVSNGRIPWPVDDEEIESLKTVLKTKVPVEQHAFVPVGEPVCIRSGPLAGAHGRVVEHKQDRLIVSISLLQRSISVSICPEWVERDVRKVASYVV